MALRTQEDNISGLGDKQGFPRERSAAYLPIPLDSQSTHSVLNQSQRRNLNNPNKSNAELGFGSSPSWKAARRKENFCAKLRLCEEEGRWKRSCFRPKEHLHLPTMARQTTGARWPYIGQTWFKGNGFIVHNVTQKQLNFLAHFKSCSWSSETSSFCWNLRPTSRHWLKFLQGKNQPKPDQAVPGQEASCV